jgi:hypothetical protein
MAPNSGGIGFPNRRTRRFRGEAMIFHFCQKCFTLGKGAWILRPKADQQHLDGRQGQDFAVDLQALLTMLTHYPKSKYLKSEAK